MLYADQKNIRSGRVVHEVDGRAWNTVTVPNRFKPSEIKYSQDANLYFVNLVDLRPRKVTVSGASKNVAATVTEARDKYGNLIFDTVHVRGKTPELLRQEIEKSFPNAAFTIADTESKIKAQHKSTGDSEIDAAYQASLDTRPPSKTEIEQAYERLRKEFGQPNANGFREIFNMKITEEDAARCGIRKAVFDVIARQEEAKFNEALVRQHKILSDEMTDQQRQEYIGHFLNSFMNDTTWTSWFRQYPRNFMSYPDQQYLNRDAVLRYCAAHGFSVPSHDILDQAMRYLLAHNMLYLKAGYKRSEQDEKNAVQVYRADVPETPIISDARIQEAWRLLGKNLPQGLKLPDEKVHEIATRIGISEEMWAAMNGQQVKVKPKDLRTEADIKKELASIRPASTRKRATY
jgi:hypothetical protein